MTAKISPRILLRMAIEDGTSVPQSAADFVSPTTSPDNPQATEINPTELLRRQIKQTRDMLLDMLGVNTEAITVNPQRTHSDFPGYYQNHGYETWALFFNTKPTNDPETKQIRLVEINGEPSAEVVDVLNKKTPINGLDAIAEITKFIDKNFPPEPAPPTET